MGAGTLPPPFVPPLFDQGLGRAKKAVDGSFREFYVLNTLGLDGVVFAVPAVAASQVATTVQGIYILPCRTKIAKISVYCSAISHTDGSIKFNIVLGTGAYTSGNNAPGNDNSSVPGVTLNDSTTMQPVTLAGGSGICTNPAVAGQSVWAADVLFNVATFPNLTTGGGTGPTYAQFLAPSSPDAVWPNQGVMTLRCITPAGHTITSLIIAATLEPQPLSATYPSIPAALTAIPGYPVPNQDF
jgi:hypothetical protein